MLPKKYVAHLGIFFMGTLGGGDDVTYATQLNIVSTGWPGMKNIGTNEYLC